MTRSRHTATAPEALLDGRLSYASAERNCGPIVEALGPILAGASGAVLEIGSGSGQHAVALAAALPGLDWQPSDPFELHLDSVRAWAAEKRPPNLREPIWLDAAEAWPDLGPLAGVVAINVIHITPWVVAEGILRGAAQALVQSAPLVFYGAFKQGGQHSSESNARFDAALRAEDPSWGVRDLEELTAAAAAAGLDGPVVTEMPADNRLVCYRRR